MKESYKKLLFENVFDIYWWKKRRFGYRVNHSEDTERELLAELLDTFIEEYEKLLKKGVE